MPVSKELTSEDLFEVMSDLEPAKAQWYNLGVGLKVRRAELESIRSDHKSSSDCLRAMIEDWLDTVEPKPTWEAVIKVLRSPVLSKLRSLAGELERKHSSDSVQPPRPTAVVKGRGDRELKDSDAYEVSNYLALLEESQIYTLGLAVGLDGKTLAPFRKSPTFLDEMITRWLQGKDQVVKRGGHTWNALVKALREPRVQQNQTADKIEDAECK